MDWRHSVVRPASSLVAIVVAAVFATAGSCGPPLQLPPQPYHSRFDSLTEAEARNATPEYRASRFPLLGIHDPTPRPALPAGADVNDASAYYRLGDSVERRLPGTADRAYYWALRLDPTMADAYLARWALRTHGTPYRLYPGDSVHAIYKEPPNETAAADSLRAIAFMYDPFLDEALDIPQEITSLKQWQAERDPGTAGLWWYMKGDFDKAVAKWAEAIRKQPDRAGLHFPRAYAWVHLQQSDSAITDLEALIRAIEKVQDSTVAIYLSKDLLYYAIGILRGGQKRYADARTAYENAIVENFGLYMAHERLAAVALLLHDTTTALNELETATLIRGDDPVLLTFRGSILDAAGRLDEAERDLKAAVHADSDYALPYAWLGHVAEARHDTTRALATYEKYLARASRATSDRKWVSDHVARLTGHSP